LSIPYRKAKEFPLPFGERVRERNCSYILEAKND